MRLDKISKALHKVKTHLLNYVGINFSKKEVDSFFSDTIGVLYPAYSGEQRYAAYSVYKLLLNTTPTLENLISVICIVVQSAPYIKEGLPPILWKGDLAHATIKCLYVERCINKENQNKRFLKLHLMCLAGDPAGACFDVVFSENFLCYILGKKLGLSFKKYSCDAADITGCIFKCKVSKIGTRVKIQDIEATQKMKELNKKLIDSRLSLLKCSTPNLTCTMCKKTRAQCALAVWKGKENDRTK